MPERRVVVGSKVGLHARPAALFVQTAARQPVKVTIAKDGRPPVDAKSILAVLGLDVRGGEEVILAAPEGKEAEAALDELAGVVATDHDAK
jgi:phosphocarrier protein HPr